MTGKQAWDMVNRAEGLEELEEARLALADDRDLSNDEYNDLMMALSSKVYESYKAQRAYRK
jgi:hypothetical protein